MPNELTTETKSPFDIVKSNSKWQPDWNTHKQKISRVKKAFSDPSELWNAACDYFNHTQSNPLVRPEFVKTGPCAGQIIDVEIPRPFSWSGLNTYLSIEGITTSLYRYKYNDGNAYDEFSDVIKLIDDVMFSQKFEGAAVGMYKENIISREIGLAERNNTTIAVDQPLFEL